MADEPSGARQQTDYVIMFHVPEQTGQGWQVLSDSDGNDRIVKHKGAEQATRWAVVNIDELRELAESNGGLDVQAIPLRSWDPKHVELVPREPELKFT